MEPLLIGLSELSPKELNKLMAKGTPCLWLSTGELEIYVSWICSSLEGMSWVRIKQIHNLSPRLEQLLNLSERLPEHFESFLEPGKVVCVDNNMLLVCPVIARQFKVAQKYIMLNSKLN